MSNQLAGVLLGLLVGTEAPNMTPNSTDCRLISFFCYPDRAVHADEHP